MNNGAIPEIILEDEHEFTHVSAFTRKHGITTLQQLAGYQFGDLWKMDGYNLYVQNDIIDIARKHGIEHTLKYD